MKLVRGVGINDADYPVSSGPKGNQEICPFYLTWSNMLNRVYTPRKNLDKSYSECSVCYEWLRFSNFKKWMEKQDWINKELDKDLKVSGNLVYSPETCVFISFRLNVAIRFIVKPRDLPVGVYRKKNGKYVSKISMNNKLKVIGTFESVEDARLAHLKCKNEYIRRVASECDNDEVREIVEIRYRAN